MLRSHSSGWWKENLNHSFSFPARFRHWPLFTYAFYVYWAQKRMGGWLCLGDFYLEGNLFRPFDKCCCVQKATFRWIVSLESLSTNTVKRKRRMNQFRRSPMGYKLLLRWIETLSYFGKFSESHRLACRKEG